MKISTRSNANKYFNTAREIANIHSTTRRARIGVAVTTIRPTPSTTTNIVTISKNTTAF